MKRGQATVLLLQVTISPLVSPRQAPRLDCPTVPPRVLQVQLLGVFSLQVPVQLWVVAKRGHRLKSQTTH